MSWYDPPEYVDRCEFPCIDETPVKMWNGEWRESVDTRCEYLVSGEIEINGEKIPVHYCSELCEFMSEREARE